MIIFLNGTSSSGKTSIAQAIQHLAIDQKFLHIGIDMFIKMMPYGMLGFGDLAKQGYSFEYEKNAPAPSIKIISGDFAKKLESGIAKTVKALASLNFNIIVDEVVLEEETMKKYITELDQELVYFVRIFCELKILQEREMLRNDRSWGLAYYQFHHIHNPKFVYDLEIDTTSSSVFDLAKKILNFTEKNKAPLSFKNMKSSLL